MADEKKKAEWMAATGELEDSLKRFVAALNAVGYAGNRAVVDQLVETLYRATDGEISITDFNLEME